MLHSDNGTPMRGSTMISTLQWLGVIPSAYPERWSGSTRIWLPIGLVVLNPERAPDQAAAYQAAA